MNRNPLIPFALIAVLGIALMFFLSVKGLGDAEEMANKAEGGEEQADTASANPEEIYQKSCIGCHGGDYQGGAGPALKGVGDRLSQEEIADIVVNGKGNMPPGLVAQDQAPAMAEWLAGIK
ncbi:cytochrome C [Bacillus canaveralius]|uniref:Cytochrome C n=1 Tax=Bacillus canaveralius TaxID=1403243 RepID=A0A2N5GR66_9BACI|nr:MULTISPECIES: cytochrome c [Bacillus]PLR85919.1 cytochrome C [Bacillus canaveralius]PLR87619.1 cytochrome C [Bacillus sp. V33-4]PLS00038.1 cytochrome C [Bacillus canaveralius]RSK56225.1 cytochrome c [Bacillus canaveralius]